MPHRRRHPVQLSLDLSKRWGGARKGAGRKPRNPQARRNVPHVTRPGHKSRFPTLVTLRAVHVIGSLRREMIRAALRLAMWRQSRRHYAPKFHVAHFSIQEDHIHLIVEGQDPGAEDERRILRSGLTGLASSLARLVNKLLGRRGAVWADRHHRRDLRSPSEVRTALLYVLQNWKRHGCVVFGHGVVDPYSSATRFSGWSERPTQTEPAQSWPAALPRTWLLRIGWCRTEGPLDLEAVPARSADLAPIVKTYLDVRRTEREAL